MTSQEIEKEDREIEEFCNEAGRQIFQMLDEEEAQAIPVRFTDNGK